MIILMLNVHHVDKKIDKKAVKKVINDPNILAKETHELSCLLLKLFNKNIHRKYYYLFIRKQILLNL